MFYIWNVNDIISYPAPRFHRVQVQYKDEVDGRELLVVCSFIILERRAVRQILY